MCSAVAPSLARKSMWAPPRHSNRITSMVPSNCAANVKGVSEGKAQGYHCGDCVTGIRETPLSPFMPLVPTASVRIMIVWVQPFVQESRHFLSCSMLHILQELLQPRLEKDLPVTANERQRREGTKYCGLQIGNRRAGPGVFKPPRTSFRNGKRSSNAPTELLLSTKSSLPLCSSAEKETPHA